MFTHHYLRDVNLGRKNKALVKKVVVSTAIFLTVVMYSGKNVHMERDEGSVHLGVGAVHSENNEIQIATGVGGGWQERLRGPLEADDPRVVARLRARHLHQPSTRPYNLNTYVNKLNYKDMESWKFLHERLIHLLGKRPPGFFVEAGALDGEYLSNTLHLEKVYGWHGLLVEPNPLTFKHLLKKNRRAWSSNTCLAITPYPKEMVLEAVDTHAETDTTQALWVIRGSSFLTEAGGKDQRYQAMHFDKTYASVQCFPFITYLKALNITKIDLFSLDVEGAEESVLATVPWDSVEISVLLVEHHGKMKDKDTEFVQGVEARGYDLHDYRIDKDNIGDYIFLKKGFL